MFCRQRKNSVLADFTSPKIPLQPDDHLMDQFIPNFHDETVQTAVKNLITYSLTIIIIPLGSIIAWLRQSEVDLIFCNSCDYTCSHFAFSIRLYSLSVGYKNAKGRIVAVMLAGTTFSKHPVYLGFGNALEPQLSYRLLSHYMPLGKIGGKPAWLNPVSLPANNSLLCRICEKPMVFLIQVYATNPNDQDYSFHRTLFFFICRNSECSRTNDASNVRAFRCTLSRFNDFYASEQPIDPDLEGYVPDPFWKQTYPHLCHICGCNATKKCARCESAWYCSREHQIIDWSASHKKECSKQSSTDEYLSTISADEKIDDENSWIKRKRSVATNRFVFPEYAIEMGVENLPRSNHVDSDGDDDDNSDSGDDNVEIRMEEYRQYIKSIRLDSQCDSGNGDLEDLEDFADKDTAFKYFNKVVASNPEQILRYSRGGEPLLATDHAPLAETVPPCSLCGSERQFELQLMPHLLALIGVDDPGKSIDWATLMLYTCTQNCHIPNDGYAEEYVHKQDFR
ncbi:Programmed cell death protein 2 [Dirofilaria immitis]|nr:Programmed cell death protein 2 [Dirofilaria immitis]